ncbi:hypothetical protein [Leptospira interrogans]|uniref:Uncharacterized protein n=2 Tax=Leptospira interrogans TaxID=173 RepID=A0AAQ0AZ50_LEPIR|nr:hypothetical protein [Leptospira interrogans]MCR8649347.1 hypothetical protein [Leptospira interrogans serovar Bataviae]OAM86817.1 hypothetical protein A1343_12515 [Leptospira interrogans serovar Bataviae]QOI38280.1 hypothetical protein Lepto1548_08305 [Leptospira interrogans serovar Bataviae]QOI42953.1 hypothetical protein Lepto782_12255 [Leptospira interrogans serovar Canicola]QOI50411.1 hypothetical protein Lepto1489_08100 [Leptospira interrogans serovar Bataviae]
MSRKRKVDPTIIFLLAITMLILTVIAYYHWFRRISKSTLDIKLKISIYFFHFTNVALISTAVFHNTPLAKDYGILNFSLEFSIASLIAFIPSLGLQWILEKLQLFLRRIDII